PAGDLDEQVGSAAEADGRHVGNDRSTRGVVPGERFHRVLDRLEDDVVAEVVPVPPVLVVVLEGQRLIPEPGLWSVTNDRSPVADGVDDEVFVGKCWTESIRLHRAKNCAQHPASHVRSENKPNVRYVT